MTPDNAALDNNKPPPRQTKQTNKTSTPTQKPQRRQSPPRRPMQQVISPPLKRSPMHLVSKTPVLSLRRLPTPMMPPVLKATVIGLMK